MFLMFDWRLLACKNVDNSVNKSLARDGSTRLTWGWIMSVHAPARKLVAAKIVQFY
jgi:hypothetical protein